MMYTNIHKFLLVIIVLTASNACLGDKNKRAVSAIELDKQNTNESILLNNNSIQKKTRCKEQVTAEQLVSLKNKYAISNSMIVKTTPIDINGDDYCDLIIDSQAFLPVCNPNIEESKCNLKRLYQWTDFYLGLPNNKFTSKPYVAGRDRSTSGGQYTAYSIQGNKQPFIVWDLRGNGRVEQYSNSYMIFQWHKNLDYLGTNNKYDYSVKDKKEAARAVLNFHNKTIQDK